MLNPQVKIEEIIGSKREFSYSDINDIALALNNQTSEGKWEVAVQHFAYTNSTHLSLFKNNTNLHPTYRFIAISTGEVKSDKARFKLKDFARDSGVEKSIIW